MGAQSSMTEYASTVSVALYVNAVNRTIQQNGVTKVINDDFWNKNIVPILYPVWDADKDKLETFVYYKDGTAFMAKNKYQRNQKTGEYKWVSYEFDLSAFPESEVTELFEKLQEKYIEYRDVEDFNLDNALRRIYQRDNIVNWNKIVMIRKFLLMDSDWTISRDSPLTEEQQELWISYRQKLRDIPQDQEGIPAAEVVFPITPTKYEKMVKAEETSADYLTDLEGHYFHLNQSVYTKYSDRILTYLSIAISVETIDEIPVVKRQDNTISLDDILENIVSGGLN
jgi:hypothetical protein